MATVPRLQGPQVGQQNFQNVTIGANIDAGFAGKALGKGLSDLGESTQKIGQLINKENEEADKLRAKELAISARKLKNDLLLKAQKDYTGSNAGKAYDEIMPELRSYRDKEYNGLANARQQRFFDAEVMEVEAELDRGLSSHVAAESAKYEESVYSSGLEVYQQEASLNYNDPTVVREKIFKSVQSVEEYAQRRGLAPEQALLEKNKAVANNVAGVMMRHLNNNDPVSAKKFLDEYKDAMDQDSVAKLEGQIKENTTEVEALRLAENVIAKKGLSMTSALKEARDLSKDNPELQKRAVAEIKTRIQEREQALNITQEQQYLSATQYINNKREMPPQSMLSTLTPERRANLVRYYEQGAVTKENYAEFQKLMARSADPEAFNSFATTDFSDPKLALAPSQQEQLRKRRDDLLAKRDEAVQKSDEIRTEDAAVKGILKTVGINPGTEREQLFYEQLGYEKKVLARQLGREPTAGEVRDRANAIVLEVPGTGFLGFGKKKAFEIDIPPAEKTNIEAALKKRGLPVSENSIRSFYMQFMNAKGKNGA